jgi:hypothetical protein
VKLSRTRAILFECECVHDVLEGLTDAFRVRRLRVGWGSTVGRMGVQTLLISQLQMKMH